MSSALKKARPLESLPSGDIPSATCTHLTSPLHWLTEIPNDRVTSLTVLTPDQARMAERLSSIIQIQSISHPDGTCNPDISKKMIETLRKFYPEVFTTLRATNVNGSLLLEWDGLDPKLKPVMLLAHTDVVPVDSRFEEGWTHPPFSGRIISGHVWGRGALDNKSSVIGILESISGLVMQGYQPLRTILVVLGHDEENLGVNGAAKVSEYLSQRGIEELEFVLDEGGFVTSGIVDGLSAPVALVGIQEKGVALFALSFDGGEGHASAPPTNSGLVRMSRALVDLEEHPLPASLNAAVDQMFRMFGPNFSRLRNAVLACRKLPGIGRILLNAMAEDPTVNAMIRTTCVPTVSKVGHGPTMLPSGGTTVLNCYLSPNDTIEKVKRHIQCIVGKYGVRVDSLERANEASKLTSTKSRGYSVVQSAIREIFGVDVVPSLTPGVTDSRYFDRFTDTIIRFAPLAIRGKRNVEQLHGTNERMPFENLVEIPKFYRSVILRATGS